LRDPTNAAGFPPRFLLGLCPKPQDIFRQKMEAEWLLLWVWRSPLFWLLFCRTARRVSAGGDAISGKIVTVKFIGFV
jgi:hypothetical protein